MEFDSTFDPTSASTRTGCLISICALCCLMAAAFTLGKNEGSRTSSGYQLAWWSVPSAVVAFFAAMFIFFAYD